MIVRLHDAAASTSLIEWDRSFHNSRIKFVCLSVVTTFAVTLTCVFDSFWKGEGNTASERSTLHR